MAQLADAPAATTRYEKLAMHYLALVQVSMVRLLVRRLERPLSHNPRASYHPGASWMPVTHPLFGRWNG
jgi:hypothetical protein